MESYKIKDIIECLESWAPSATAEEFDNVGLLVGDAQRPCTGALITLDSLEEVVDEAIAKNCNLIISFHPIIFSGMKRLTGKNYVERTVLKAIENKIAIYAIHTALDNHLEGVNHGIAQKLGLTNCQILLPKKNNLKKLQVYVPQSHIEAVKNTLFDAGAGEIGAYTECAFSFKGTGQYRPSVTAQPTHGTRGELTQVEEVQLQMVFAAHLEPKIIGALLNAHPYEEVAYECYALENSHKHSGMGAIGELPEPVAEKTFLKQLKNDFNAGGLRHSEFCQKPIKKVALLGGSGSFAIGAAIAQKADVYLTADLKYHNFFEAEGQLLLVDIGHYESEQFTKNLIHDYLTKKLPNFAFILAATNTNPVNYF